MHVLGWVQLNIDFLAQNILKNWEFPTRASSLCMYCVGLQNTVLFCCRLFLGLILFTSCTVFFEFFQSDNISIFTQTPDLTQCFQKTILCWIPTAYMLVTSCVYIPILAKRRTINRWKNISRFNLAKLVTPTFLFLQSVVVIYM